MLYYKKGASINIKQLFPLDDSPIIQSKNQTHYIYLCQQLNYCNIHESFCVIKSWENRRNWIVFANKFIELLQREKVIMKTTLKSKFKLKVESDEMSISERGLNTVFLIEPDLKLEKVTLVRNPSKSEVWQLFSTLLGSDSFYHNWDCCGVLQYRELQVSIRKIEYDGRTVEENLMTSITSTFCIVDICYIL